MRKANLTGLWYPLPTTFRIEISENSCVKFYRVLVIWRYSAAIMGFFSPAQNKRSKLIE